MQNQSPQNVADLVYRLSSNDDPVRQQAQEELRVLIATDVRRIERNQALVRRTNILCTLLFVPAYVYSRIIGREWVSDPVMYGVSGCLVIMSLLSLLQRQMARPIVALEIPQAVAPLIDVMATSGPFLCGEIKPALIRLLPRLQSSDANLLLPRHRKSLNQCLRSDEAWPYYGRLFGADLKIAILRALEQVGDKTSLPAVEKLAKSAANPQVRLAAQDCLPFLQQRADQAHKEQTLLRASGAGNAPSVLLRPASSTEEAAPQQLLRASTGDKR